jgi:AraC family transcriptional regulator
MQAIAARSPGVRASDCQRATDRGQSIGFGSFAAISSRLLQRYGDIPAAPRVSTRQLPKWRLRAVCDYIQANLDCDLSLAELSNVAGFSQSHFKPLFRQAVGLPVHRYVVECRVERARQLLLQGSGSLADIALEAGFSHQTHMARCLRRVLGISPADVLRLGRH